MTKVSLSASTWLPRWQVSQTQEDGESTKPPPIGRPPPLAIRPHRREEEEEEEEENAHPHSVATHGYSAAVPGTRGGDDNSAVPLGRGYLVINGSDGATQWLV